MQLTRTAGDFELDKVEHGYSLREAHDTSAAAPLGHTTLQLVPTRGSSLTQQQAAGGAAADHHLTLLVLPTHKPHSTAAPPGLTAGHGHAHAPMHSRGGGGNAGAGAAAGAPHAYPHHHASSGGMGGKLSDVAAAPTPLFGGPPTPTDPRMMSSGGGGGVGHKGRAYAPEPQMLKDVASVDGPVYGGPPVPGDLSLSAAPPHPLQSLDEASSASLAGWGDKLPSQKTEHHHHRQSPPQGQGSKGPNPHNKPSISHSHTQAPIIKGFYAVHDPRAALGGVGAAGWGPVTNSSNLTFSTATDAWSPPTAAYGGPPLQQSMSAVADAPVPDMSAGMDVGKPLHAVEGAVSAGVHAVEGAVSAGAHAVVDTARAAAHAVRSKL